MPVRITGLAIRKARGNRGIGFNREVRQIAEHVITAQQQGAIAPKEVAAFLNNLPRNLRTRDHYTPESMRRLMIRGAELKLAIHLQTRAEAGARPRRPRRSQDQIRHDMQQRAKAAQERRVRAALSEMPIIADRA